MIVALIALAVFVVLLSFQVYYAHLEIKVLKEQCNGLHIMLFRYFDILNEKVKKLENEGEEKCK
jgi:hypothetical protein